MNRLAPLLALIVLVGASIATDQKPIIVRAGGDATVPEAIRSKLVGAGDVTAVVALPGDLNAAVYNTIGDTKDITESLDNDPHILVFKGDTVALDVSVTSLSQVGPVGFDGMARLPMSKGSALIAAAFRLGADGAGTFFVFVGQEGGSYKVLGTLKASQAQLRFDSQHPERLEIWTADGMFSRNPDEQCVWCFKYYTREVYEWRDGKLTLIQKFRSKGGYKPETFDETRFVLK